MKKRKLKHNAKKAVGIFTVLTMTAHFVRRRFLLVLLM